MWASTSDYYEDGRRYSVQELGALIYPLELLIDMARNLTSKGAFCPPILQRMDIEEVTFALHELFQALLEDIPIPADGHPGYQEALIAEILGQMYACIEIELKRGVPDDEISEKQPEDRLANFPAILPESDDDGRPFAEGWLEDRGVSPGELFPYLSPDLDSEDWKDLLDIVAGEFLADRDWEFEALLDRPVEETVQLREMMGIDLDRMHRLPHSPTKEEFASATKYLDAVSQDFVRLEFGE